MAGAVAVPALAQDATHFAPPEIAWAKPSAKHAESADAAGTAQRVDPSTLSACGTGKVLTLSATGTFTCTDTIANASYANNAGDADTIDGIDSNDLKGGQSENTEGSCGITPNGAVAATNCSGLYTGTKISQCSNGSWIVVVPCEYQGR